MAKKLIPKVQKKNNLLSFNYTAPQDNTRVIISGGTPTTTTRASIQQAGQGAWNNEVARVYGERFKGLDKDGYAIIEQDPGQYTLINQDTIGFDKLKSYPTAKDEKLIQVEDLKRNGSKIK